MTDERYNGQFYAKGNDMVVEDLEKEGFLVAKEAITHSYPHCWRCRAPHHLPGYRAVVLLRGCHQGCRRGRLRGHPSLTSRLGQGAHDLHDLRAQRLVHLSASASGACPFPSSTATTAAPTLSPPRPSPMWQSSSVSTAPTCGSTGSPPTCCPRASSAPSAARSTSPKRLTSWTCGLTPALPGPPWPRSAPT